MGLDGSKWVKQPTPKVLSSPTGVSCWSSGCIAIGGTNSYATFAESWNGTRWLPRGTPGEGAPSGHASTWKAVNCTSAADCTAVGQTYTVSGNPILISDWNGKVWSQVPGSNPGSGSGSLNAIACTKGNSVCTAVGAYVGSDDFGHTLAMRN
jgi:hypothetical protein